MEIINKSIDEIIPYEKNPRKNDEAVQYVANSISAFGFKVPIVIDKNGIIVAGHTRYKAAKYLKLDEVPCIIADDLNDEQIKAFRLADNKVGEVAEWNEDLLAYELADIIDIDMTDFGFSFDEDEDVDDKYTVAVNIPQYEITGACPTIDECLDTEKTDCLIKEIEASDISEENKKFLISAAQRHLRFNYKLVAEYYAHADPEVQRLMEKSALVIIDVDNAIANGYAKISSRIAQLIEGD